MKTAYGKEYFEKINDAPGMNRIEFNPFTVIDFALLRLAAGERYEIQTEGREYGLDIMAGVCTITVNGTRFSSLGGRSDVFGGKPTLVYAGCRSSVEISAETDIEVGVGSALSQTEIEPYLISPDECRSGHWGRNTTRRYFDYMLDYRTPSERLSFAEVTVSNGNWATYPPHKHEEGVADEAFQEELYFYQVQPKRGLGFCAQYGGQMPEDFAFPITHNTIHKMPFGYHTVAAAPGYSVCYLAVYAGHDKTHIVAADPDHAWYATDYERVLGHLSRDFTQW